MLKADNSVHDSRLFNEAQEETGWNNKKAGRDMMAMFTNQQTDHRGWSEPLGDAWIMKHQISSGWDWHLAQHEASYNYDYPDHGYLSEDISPMTKNIGPNHYAVTGFYQGKFTLTNDGMAERFDKSLDLEELLNSIKYGHEIENRTDDGIPE